MKMPMINTSDCKIQTKEIEIDEWTKGYDCHVYHSPSGAYGDAQSEDEYDAVGLAISVLMTKGAFIKWDEEHNPVVPKVYKPREITESDEWYEHILMGEDAGIILRRRKMGGGIIAAYRNVVSDKHVCTVAKKGAKDGVI